MKLLHVKTISGSNYVICEDDSGKYQVLGTDSEVGHAFIGLFCEWKPEVGTWLRIDNGRGGHTSTVVHVEEVHDLEIKVP